jgi:hypothetical protein
MIASHITKDIAQIQSFNKEQASTIEILLSTLTTHNSLIIA